MNPLSLDEDMHVHSTFSVGRDSIAQNAERAEVLGLDRIGCVDQVRVDTTWVPELVREVRRVGRRSATALTVGVEANILNERGELDVPPVLRGVDFIYIAEHSLPWGAGCLVPADARRLVARGKASLSQLLDALVGATAIAMRRAPAERVVLAHLFSLLPTLGMSEDDVSAASLRELTGVAVERGAVLAVNERWRCPGPRVVAAFTAAGVPVVASTASRRLEDIGRYRFVEEVRLALRAPTRLAG